MRWSMMPCAIRRSLSRPGLVRVTNAIEPTTISPIVNRIATLTIATSRRRVMLETRTDRKGQRQTTEEARAPSGHKGRRAPLGAVHETAMDQQDGDRWLS